MPDCIVLLQRNSLFQNSSEMCLITQSAVSPAGDEEVAERTSLLCIWGALRHWKHGSICRWQLFFRVCRKTNMMNILIFMVTMLINSLNLTHVNKIMFIFMLVFILCPIRVNKNVVLILICIIKITKNNFNTFSLNISSLSTNNNACQDKWIRIATNWLGLISFL